MQHLYPDRMPGGPTSPGYPEEIAATGPELAAPLRSELAARITGGSVNPLGPGLTASGAVSLDDAEGGTALRLALTGESWAGVYVFLGGYDAAGADTVAMRMKLPSDVAALELKLEGPENNARSVNLLEYAVGGPDEAGWSEFSVPLAAFEGVDLSRLAILGLWNPSDRTGEFVTGEMIVDDTRFETGDRR